VREEFILVPCSSILVEAAKSGSVAIYDVRVRAGSQLMTLRSLLHLGLAQPGSKVKWAVCDLIGSCQLCALSSALPLQALMPSFGSKVVAFSISSSFYVIEVGISRVIAWGNGSISTNSTLSVYPP
jgi:hypothetical protein